MGVFDARDQVVPSSLLMRSYGKVGFPAEYTSATREAARHDPRAVVYAGRLARHFGHFTLESLANLWYAKEHPELPIAWAWPSDGPEPGYKPWQAAMLEILGIGNEAVFVTAPARFDRVFVPQAGYRIQDFMAPQQAAFLAAYPPRTRDAHKRLWLSRTRTDSGVIHAPRLEAELAAAGWTIVHPQTLTIPEQLERLATAGHVAGDEGSAFHLLALLADVTGLRVDIFCRHPERTVEEQNANYQTIAEARGLDQHMHVMPEEVLIEQRSTRVTKLATTLAGYLEILGAGRARVEPVPGPGASLARALATAGEAGSCLEISTGDPVCAGLDVPVRNIVSPAFPFDPRGLQSVGLELFEMPPAEFFEHLVAPDRRYDLVVLDGPTLTADLPEWITSCQRHAHAGTTWLVSGRLSGEQLPGMRHVTVEHGVWTVVPGSSAVDRAIDSLTRGQ